MTFDRIIAILSCIASIICTVIVALSYRKDRKEKK